MSYISDDSTHGFLRLLNDDATRRARGVALGWNKWVPRVNTNTTAAWVRDPWETGASCRFDVCLQNRRPRLPWSWHRLAIFERMLDQEGARSFLSVRRVESAPRSGWGGCVSTDHVVTYRPLIRRSAGDGDVGDREATAAWTKVHTRRDASTGYHASHSTKQALQIRTHEDRFNGGFPRNT